MDVIKEIHELEDEEAKKKAQDMIKQTLERSDEEFYFEEETSGIAGHTYIEEHLVIENGSYFLIDDFKHVIPYCVLCWKEKKQLNKRSKNGNSKKDALVCLVCALEKNI